MTSVSQPDIGTSGLPDAGAAPLVRRFAFARTGDAALTGWLYVGVGLLAAVLYLWDLTISGWANSYYAAAAQAAALDWKAWFFGSVDASNWITVDKPPLATMVLGLSVRTFGLSPLAILLPEALMGIASVVIVTHLVRRTFGLPAGLIAGTAMALTPVAVLMFRFDNPDALLTLLFVVATWTAIRAIESGGLRWVVATSVLVGFAFLTKYLQADLVVPAFALTWLLFATGSLRHRLWGLVVAGVGLVVASGWWVAVVELVPASDRPYIGGSQTNSALELLLGYDGLQRLFGFFSGRGGLPGEPPGGPVGGVAAGGGQVGAGFSGEPGPLRLLNDQLGGQIAWLLPLALVALVVGLWLRRRAPRTDPGRAAVVLWGAWLLTHALVFSFMSGIIHAYYTVAMAPAIAALTGIGVADLWRLRGRFAWGGTVLAGALVATALLGAVLLARTPEFVPWVGPLAVILGLATGAALALPDVLRGWPRLAAGALALSLTACLIGPTAFAVATIGSSANGGDPAAGPNTAGPGGQGGPGGQAGFGGPAGSGGPAGAGGQPGRGPTTAVGPGTSPAGLGVDLSNGAVQYLETNRGSADWLVAVSSANESAPLQLATGQPVMAMGGFTGSDPATTVERLQALVASGRLRFVLSGGFGLGFGPGGPGPLGSVSMREVNAWITQHCQLRRDVANGLYDCQGAAQ